MIVERLGEAGQTGVDVISIIHQFNLPHDFPEEVLAEVRGIAKGFNAETQIAHREDLTGHVIATIDPDNAKDYDDAITLEQLSHSDEPARSKRGLPCPRPGP